MRDPELDPNRLICFTDGCGDCPAAYDLAKLIVDTKDFDDRIHQGDPELVNLIASNGKINLFSFASKYCTYHNVEIYQRDDYSIFDGVVRKVLPHYIKGLSKYQVDQWRKTVDYQAYNTCIGRLLDENHIDIPLRRRKIDHFLWYQNRKAPTP